MAGPRVSIIVVSRARPRWLDRCLTSLSQLAYPDYEIVVVACAAGIATVRNRQDHPHIKQIGFDAPNISRARNLGVAASAGDLVAFIDDDAVAEPTWLHHLVQPFGNPDVQQAGGVTLGRNGISVQHGAARIDGNGETVPLPQEIDTPQVVPALGDFLPRLHGTNMMFRRGALFAAGGFDERYHFYLDECDLNRRIAQSGGATMHVPKAVVHHASAANALRDKRRVPRSVFEIGASYGVFFSTHLPPDRRSAAWMSAREGRVAWLRAHRASGALSREDLESLERQLDKGFETGSARKQRASAIPETPGAAFLPYPGRPGATDHYLFGSMFRWRGMRRKAKALVRDGARVTIFEYSPSTLFHTVRYEEEGYWRHRGGIWGRELRNEPLFRLATRRSRVEATLQRIGGIRYLTPMRRKL